MRNLRICFDSTLDKDFMEGVIDSLNFNGLSKELFVICGGGNNFYLTLKLNSKKIYKEEIDYYKSIPNTITKEEPYFFVCLTEIKANENIKKPQYFFLNMKEKNYCLKLLMAGKLYVENKSLIGNYYYCSPRYTDIIGMFPMFSDYTKFLGIIVCKKENVNYIKELLKNTPCFIMLLVQEDSTYESGVKQASVLAKFIKSNKLLKNVNSLQNTIVENYDL